MVSLLYLRLRLFLASRSAIFSVLVVPVALSLVGCKSLSMVPKVTRDDPEVSRQRFSQVGAHYNHLQANFMLF